jgi:hypothetical protein
MNVSISKYHLIRLILDNLYEEQKKKGDPQWEGWLNTLGKVFNGTIPKALLLGLKRKSESSELCNLCDVRLLQSQHIKSKELQESAVDAYERWIERRDRGNKRALEKREKEKQEQQAKIRQIQQEAHETYIQQMLPQWKQTLEDYKRKRDGIGGKHS